MTRKPKTPGRGSLPSAEEPSPRAGLSAPGGGTAADGADPSTGERMRAAGEVTGPESRDAREAQHGAGGGVNRPHAQDRCTCEGHHVCAACAALTPEQPPRTGAPCTRAREHRWVWCTDERLAALCVLLEAGIPVSTACARLGIPRQSLREARRDDAGVETQIADALALFEEGLVRSIMDATQEANIGEGKVSRGDWKAGAWLLERRFPKKYAPPPKRLETTGKDGGPQEMRVSVSIEDAIEGARPTPATIADAGGPRQLSNGNDEEGDDES